MKKLKYIDLFAGIGAFRQAFDPLGMECVFTSEINSYAQDMYKLLYGEGNVYGDITKVREEDIPEHDVLCSGIPCQPFSQNGNKQGFKDVRGTLFFDVYRIAKAKRPKYVIIENVVSLLSNNKKETITTICEKLSEIGYAVDFTIYSTLDFGIPQQRSRVFIIGVLNACKEEWSTTSNKNINNVKKIITEKSNGNVKSFNFPFPEPPMTPYSLENLLEKEEFPVLEFPDFFLKKINDEEYRIKVGTKLGYEDFKPIPYHTNIDFSILKSNTRRGRVKHGITKTLDTLSEIAVFTGKGFRHISPLETFRLQGFSDEAYRKLEGKFSNHQLYIRTGNTIPVPILSTIGKSILEFERDGARHD